MVLGGKVIQRMEHCTINDTGIVEEFGKRVLALVMGLNTIDLDRSFLFLAVVRIVKSKNGSEECSLKKT